MNFRPVASHSLSSFKEFCLKIPFQLVWIKCKLVPCRWNLDDQSALPITHASIVLEGKLPPFSGRNVQLRCHLFIQTHTHTKTLHDIKAYTWNFKYLDLILYTKYVSHNKELGTIYATLSGLNGAYINSGLSNCNWVLKGNLVPCTMFFILFASGVS